MTDGGARVVSLAPATAADIPSLLAWMQDFYAHERIPFDPVASERALRELIDNPAFGRVFTLMDDGAAVGYAAVALGFSLEFGGRSAFLDELYVRPASRGLGIGTRALRLLQEACRGLGARSLALEVGLGNAGATGLYRREGFSTIGRQLMTRRL
jgi:ribosomal protein S18 acetylase RimI-like enzyme